MRVEKRLEEVTSFTILDCQPKDGSCTNTVRLTIGDSKAVEKLSKPETEILHVALKTLNPNVTISNIGDHVFSPSTNLDVEKATKIFRKFFPITETNSNVQVVNVQGNRGNVSIGSGGVFIDGVEQEPGTTGNFDWTAFARSFALPFSTVTSTTTSTTGGSTSVIQANNNTGNFAVGSGNVQVISNTGANPNDIKGNISVGSGNVQYTSGNPSSTQVIRTTTESGTNIQATVTDVKPGAKVIIGGKNMTTTNHYY